MLGSWLRQLPDNEGNPCAAIVAHQLVVMLMESRIRGRIKLSNAQEVARELTKIVGGAPHIYLHGAFIRASLIRYQRAVLLWRDWKHVEPGLRTESRIGYATAKGAARPLDDPARTDECDL
jgi:hypothetical protein